MWLKLLTNRYFAAGLIVLVNLIFKEYRVAHTGLSYDENFSAYFGQADISEIIRFARETDPNPPLYPILLHYWMELFSDSEYSIRMLSVIANSLAAGMLYLFCARFFNWQTAVFASLMFFTSNEIYYYSEEARTYSLVLLFAISSFYLFLSLIEKPRIQTMVLLGIVNAILFYLHYVTGFILLSEALLLPLSLPRANNALVPKLDVWLKSGLQKKQTWYLLGSFIVFGILLSPWIDRVMQLFLGGGKDFWLAKPTYREFKDCVYGFFNSKTLFNVHVALFGSFALILIFFRPLRHPGISLKRFLFVAITGPLLLFLIYLAAQYSPIFLKRYVLFTLIGCILLFAYTYSLLRINFFVKLGAFLVLSFFSFQSMTFPRSGTDQYDKAAWFFKRVKTEQTFVSNDLPDLLSYYYAHDCFNVRPYASKGKCLQDRGIFTPASNTWPNEQDLSRYRVIYYTHTFADYYDANHEVETALGARFKFIGRWDHFYRGLHILVYYNPAYKAAAD